jgi:hypothetical protein
MPSSFHFPEIGPPLGWGSSNVSANADVPLGSLVDMCALDAEALRSGAASLQGFNPSDSWGDHLTISRAMATLALLGLILLRAFPFPA